MVMQPSQVYLRLKQQLNWITTTSASTIIYKQELLHTYRMLNIKWSHHTTGGTKLSCDQLYLLMVILLLVLLLSFVGDGSQVYIEEDTRIYNAEQFYHLQKQLIEQHLSK